MEKKTTLIMLPQPILVSDEETSSGGWMFDTEQKIIHNPSRHNVTDYDIRIVAGIDGLPTLDLSLIAEEIGWVDVEAKVKEFMGLPSYLPIQSMSPTMKSSFEFGVECYKAAQSLNEKKYSEEDMIYMFRRGLNYMGNKSLTDTVLWDEESKQRAIESIQFVSKPKEYKVEVEMEDMLQTRHGDQWYDLPNQKEGRELDGIYQTVKRIKITNNTIKVIKNS